MNKIVTFIHSDGWANTLRYVCKAVGALLPHTAHTYCLFAERDAVAAVRRKEWDGYSCGVITRPEEMEQIDFGRMKLTPWRKWLEAGSRAVVVYRGSVPVAFGWTHFRSHSIHSVGTFDMGPHIAWLGPSFVHVSHRGKGLQQLVIQQRIADAPSAAIDAFITSVNTGNTPSLRSFEKLGFKKGMEVSCKYGILGNTPPNCLNVKLLDGQAEDFLKLTT